MDDFTASYLDAISGQRNVSIIYIDNTTGNVVLTSPLDLTYYQDYQNVIQEHMPNGYTNDLAQTNSTGFIGISKIKASEHHFKIEYSVAPTNISSTITVNYFYNDQLIKTTGSTGSVGDTYDLSDAEQNIPDGYHFLEVCSGSTTTYGYKDSTINIMMTKDPTSSYIEVLCRAEDTGAILSSQSIPGQVGSSFSANQYISGIPDTYVLDYIQNNVTSFTQDSQVVVAECKLNVGSITVLYSGGNVSYGINNQETTTGIVGTSLNLQPYIDAATSAGYQYDGSSNSNPTYQVGSQTVTINISVPITTFNYTLNYQYSGNTVYSTSGSVQGYGSTWSGTLSQLQPQQEFHASSETWDIAPDNEPSSTNEFLQANTNNQVNINITPKSHPKPASSASSSSGTPIIPNPFPSSSSASSSNSGTPINWLGDEYQFHFELNGSQISYTYVIHLVKGHLYSMHTVLDKLKAVGAPVYTKNGYEEYVHKGQWYVVSDPHRIFHPSGNGYSYTIDIRHS